MNNLNKIVTIQKKIVNQRTNETLFYVDNSNIYYTTEDIDNIISMPNVDINMTRRQKDNKLVSTKGTLQIVYKGCHQMLVLIEDSNSGFTFYKWFLRTCFPTIDFIFISTDGGRNIKNVVTFCLDKYTSIKEYLLIFDNKQDDIIFMTKLYESLTLLKDFDKKIMLFKPVSVEEIILSWPIIIKIGNKHSINFAKLIQNSKGRAWYTYDIITCKYIVNGHSISNLEQALTQELIAITHRTPYQYVKKTLSDCYFCDCCNKYYFINGKTKFVAELKDCEIFSTQTKVDAYKESSLLKLLGSNIGNYTVENEYIWTYA